MFTALGLAAYYVVVSLGVLDFQLLLRRQITAPGTAFRAAFHRWGADR